MAQVVDDVLAHVHRQRQAVEAAPLSVNGHLALPPVDVAELQRCDLGVPQPQPEGQGHDGQVTPSGESLGPFREMEMESNRLGETFHVAPYRRLLYRTGVNRLSLRERISLILFGMAAAVVATLVVLVPVARAFGVGLCVISLAWLALLPRGWFASADFATRRVIRMFLALRLGMPLVFQAMGNFADVFFTGGSDSFRYHQYGSRVAADLLAAGASTSHTGIPGTGAIELAAGYFYAAGAPARLAGDYLFNVFATIGILLFWWATNHLAGARRSRYTMFVLLTPSLLLWNAGISKEAAMIFATGLIVAGVFLLSQGFRPGRGLLYLAFGLAVAGFVRPHIALLLVASAIVGVALAGARRGGESRGRRLVPVVVAAASLLVLLPLTKAVINPAGDRSLVDAAYAQAENTATVGGRSSFETAPTRSVLDMPRAIVTVLVRPFPWEVRSGAQLLASAEAMTLAGMLAMALWTVARRRTPFLRSPLVVMSATFTLVFCAAFASLGNFGLLVRERMQVLPFVILLAFSLHAVASGVPKSPRRRIFSHSKTTTIGCVRAAEAEVAE